MKKKIVIVAYVGLALMAFIGLAFAGSGIDNSVVLKNIAVRTDVQMASMLIDAANNQAGNFYVSEPSVVSSETQFRQKQLIDITKERTQDYEVVPVYPKLYTLPLFEKAENRRIIRVYGLSYSKSEDMKIEVYYTGGDWMRFGFVYLVTAGDNWASAYFISTLSTPDREEGSIPPAISPFDAEKLHDFIVNGFLDENGNVKEKFQKVASLSSDP